MVAKKLSGGLLQRGGLFDDAHHVAFLHDEQVFAVELDLGAGPFAEQDAVADLDVEGDQPSAFVAGAGADGDHFAFARLFLCGVRDDDTACGLLVGFDASNQDTVMQWTERHIVLLKDKQILRGPSAPIRGTGAGPRTPCSVTRVSIWFQCSTVSRGRMRKFSTRVRRLIAA